MSPFVFSNPELVGEVGENLYVPPFPFVFLRWTAGRMIMESLSVAFLWGGEG